MVWSSNLCCHHPYEEVLFWGLGKDGSVTVIHSVVLVVHSSQHTLILLYGAIQLATKCSLV